MKTTYCIITALIAAILSITLISCIDPIPAGLETAVRGQVSDSVKQKRLGGAKVIVWSCDVSIMRGKECYNVVDSVRTDREGRFKIDFITAGDATGYQVSVYADASFINAPREEVTPGISNFISLSARELNHIRVDVQIENNQLNPIYLRTASSNLAKIYPHTRDTVLYGRVLPMAENPLYFTVYDTSINNARMSVDLVNIDLRDTTYFLKRISNPQEWEIGQ